MKVASALLFLALGVSGPALAQDPDKSAPEASSSRRFFPRDWVRGFLDGAVAPPHNEPDLNRCASSASMDGGADAPCSAFARYRMSGYVELQPVGTGRFRPAFIFLEPHLYLGRNVPQRQYNFSPAAMAYEHTWGFGIELPRNFELRLTKHSVSWFGRYGGNLGVADLGKNGPLGMYTTISARWYFGGYNRRK